MAGPGDRCTGRYDEEQRPRWQRRWKKSVKELLGRRGWNRYMIESGGNWKEIVLMIKSINGS